jgi:uncharacterized membrane protein
MNHILVELSEILISIFNAVSIVILVYGFVRAMLLFLKNETHSFKMNSMDHAALIADVKNTMGTYVLLSLEILIAADIIHSILYPTLQDIALLSATVVIRTVISFFLRKEIEEDEKK